MQCKELLITGATGFIGKPLTDRIRHDFPDINVTAIGSKDVDLTNWNDTIDFMFHWRWDSVINLAGILENNDGVVEKQLSMMANVLDCVPYDWDGQFIHASSMVVYGMPKYLPVDECHPLFPLDDYAMSKIFVEHALKYSLPDNYLILRFPGVFSKERKDGALYNFIQRTKDGQDIILTDTQSVPWDLIYLDDLIDGIVKAFSENVRGVLNLSYGEPVSLLEVARMIINIFYHTTCIQHPNKINHPIFQMKIDKAQRSIGWNPPTLSSRLMEMCIDA